MDYSAKDLNDFKKLFETTYPPLVIFASDYVKELDVCKVLVQDIFLKVWQDSITFRMEAHRIEFFYRSVKEVCIGFLEAFPDKIQVDVGEDELEIMKSPEYYRARAKSLEASARR